MAKSRFSRVEIENILGRTGTEGMIAIGRALLAINARQTQSEQDVEATRLHNGVGFTPADARMGTSMAKQFLSKNWLSEKQLAYWRRPNRRGVPRIFKYAEQLRDIAETKARAKEVMNG